MATIVFFPDLAEGHLLPTFGLARSLADRGHDVHYIGLIQKRELVLKFGFSYHVIFEKEYPGEYMKNLKTKLLQETKHNINRIMDHIPLMVKDSTALDVIIDKIKPDILISTVFILLESLIAHYRYNIAQVILSPFIHEPAESLAAICAGQYMQLPVNTALAVMNFINKRKGRSLERIADMVAPLLEIPELILCPRELALPQWKYSGNVHFIEPSIRKDALGGGPSTLSPDIPKGKQVIYASMGSQAFLFKTLAKRFYSTILEVMRANEDKDWHVVLAMDSEFQKENPGVIPSNVSLYKWAPQIQVLSKSSLAITHGGLGTVKECIFCGVPMIVLPMVNDQFNNAKYIKHHNLGIEMDVHTLAAKELETAIRHLLSSSTIRESVEKMKTLFREKEGAQIGAKFIEGLIKNRGPGTVQQRENQA